MNAIHPAAWIIEQRQSSDEQEAVSTATFCPVLFMQGIGISKMSIFLSSLKEQKWCYEKSMSNSLGLIICFKQHCTKHYDPFFTLIQSPREGFNIKGKKTY